MSEKRKENLDNRGRGVEFSNGKKRTDKGIISVYKDPYFVAVMVIAVCFVCFASDSLNG